MQAQLCDGRMREVEEAGRARRAGLLGWVNDGACPACESCDEPVAPVERQPER
jgi:hypothetical protein